jgi:hypothetical protein
VLFDREIVRILNEHCVMCHVAGGPSFSIATYEEAWLTRDASYTQILERHMPPWAAVPGYGKFVNENRLTLREQRFVVSWVEGLGPRNTGTVFLNVLDPDAAMRQELRAEIDFAAWGLGEPDHRVSLLSTTPAMNLIEPPPRVQRFLLDPGLTTDRWLSGLEYQPGEHSAIRAAVFKLAESGQWLATWTPWHGSRSLPDGLAYRVAAGAEIVAEIYTIEPGQAITAPGILGLHFAAGPTPVALEDIVLVASGEIPAATNSHRLVAETELTVDAQVLALWPTLPAGLESIEVTARLPDGRVEILLVALDVPLEWPTPYIYETPVELPRGSRLSLTGFLSNSTPLPVERQVRLTLSVAYSSR